MLNNLNRLFFNCVRQLHFVCSWSSWSLYLTACFCANPFFSVHLFKMPYTSSLIILSYSCFPDPMCFFRQQISYVFLFPCAFSDSRFQVFLSPCASSDNRFQVFLFPCASSGSRVLRCSCYHVLLQAADFLHVLVPMCFFRQQISYVFLFPCASGQCSGFQHRQWDAHKGRGKCNTNQSHNAFHLLQPLCLHPSPL